MFDVDDAQVAAAERRDALIRSIEHALQTQDHVVRLHDGPIDNSVASALNDALKHDVHGRIWDVSLVDVQCFISDRHAVPATKIIKNAFSGKINSIAVLSNDRAGERDPKLFSCIFDPSSLSNANLLTSLVLRNCFLTLPTARLMRRYLKYADNLDRLVLGMISFSSRPANTSNADPDYEDEDIDTVVGLIRAIFTDELEQKDAPQRRSSKSKSKRKSLVKRVPGLKHLAKGRAKGKTVPEPYTAPKHRTKCPSVLNIVSCAVNAAQAQKLVDILAESTMGLRDLDLSDNPINSAPNISKLSDLRAFRLGGLSSVTDLTDSKPVSISSVIDSVSMSEHLISLDLSYNPFSEDCIATLFNWLEKCDQLRQLDLRAVNLTPVGRKRIISYLRKNRGLEHLSLFGNVIDADFTDEAFHILQTANTTMVRLRADYPSHQHRSEIVSFGIRNWSGRRLLITDAPVPPALWPRVLARASSNTDADPLVFNEFAPASHNAALRADAVYHLLRQGTLLHHG